MSTCEHNKSFKCNFCAARFKRKTDLDKHKSVHTINCDRCGKSFVGKQVLRRHFLQVHEKRQDFYCIFCHKLFSRKENEWAHLLSHIGETPYNDCSFSKKRQKCEVCGKVVSVLHVHLLTHKPDKPFKCSICEKSFNNKGNLTVHFRTHTLEKPFKCNQCGTRLSSAIYLRKHCKYVHKKHKREEFHCVFCNKGFEGKQRLKTHLLRHIGETPYKDCSYTRPTKKCGVCGRMVTALSSHMLTHRDDRPFECSLCNATFKRMESLNIHVRTHTLEKIFKCQKCGTGFSRKHHLQIHCKLVHEKRKEFSCIFCKASFVLKTNLDCHLRLHIGEKPYLCQVCGTNYVTARQLRRHFRSHSNDI